MRAALVDSGGKPPSSSHPVLLYEMHDAVKPPYKDWVSPWILP